MSSERPHFSSEPTEVNLSEQSDILYVSPELLLEENNSDAAKERIAIWNEARENRALIAQKRCGDARTSLTNATRSVDIRYIACGGPNAPFENLINSLGIQMAGNFTHFDGEEMDRFIADPSQEKMRITCVVNKLHMKV